MSLIILVRITLFGRQTIKPGLPRRRDVAALAAFVCWSTACWSKALFSLSVVGPPWECNAGIGKFETLRRHLWTCPSSNDLGAIAINSLV